MDNDANKQNATPLELGCEAAQQEDVRVLYNATVGEISRYRDLEWKNTVLFTGAMATIIGSRLSWLGHNNCGVFDYYLEIAVTSLAAANIYYTCYAHWALARNRSLQARLEERMKIDTCRNNSLERNECHNFLKGFISHLLPFFSMNIAIVCFGFLLFDVPLRTELRIGTIATMVLLIFLLMLFLCNRHCKINSKLVNEVCSFIPRIFCGNKNAKNH